MKKAGILILLLMTASCSNLSSSADLEKQKIDLVLDQWHLAASQANEEKYFSYLDDESVFIGTDATENWNKPAFATWAKPYFDSGKAWSFTALERHIFFNDAGDMAWFDELLQTQMKLCRGSGVLIKKDATWKVKHYVLSMTIPNEILDSVVQTKGMIEDSLINTLKSKQAK